MYLQFEKQTERPLKTFFTIVLHFVSNFEVDGKNLSHQHGILLLQRKASVTLQKST